MRVRRRIAIGLACLLATALSVVSAVPPAVAGTTMHLEKVLEPLDSGVSTAYFGESVAISGDTCVVGATGRCIGKWSCSPLGLGRVYVYRRNGNDWSLQARLDGTSLQFGSAVDIDGDTIVVGDPRYFENEVAAAHVFIRSGGAWVEQATLIPENGQADSAFGTSVAISGDLVAVGAKGDDGKGSVQLWARQGGSWTSSGRIWASDGAVGDDFGSALALDADTLVVGGPMGWTAQDRPGAAYIFVRSDGGWSERQKLQPEPQAGDRFGRSVALQGDTVLIGCPSHVEGTDPTGAAYFFSRSEGEWSQRSKQLPQGDAGYSHGFGTSVALNGNLAVVGAPLETSSDGRDGAVYLLGTAEGSWNNLQKLQPRDLATRDFGSEADIWSVTAIIGASPDGETPVNVFSALAPVYRFYNMRSGTHFYTPDEGEKSHVIAAWPTIFKYEGVAYGVYAPSNSQPLYRFYNRRNGSHFYTASAAERDSVIAKLAAIYSYDGPTYSVSTAAAFGKPPVWRFYNKRNGSHFYTASPTERASVIARLSGTYAYEGIAFYLGQ